MSSTEPTSEELAEGLATDMDALLERCRLAPDEWWMTYGHLASSSVKLRAQLTSRFNPHSYPVPHHFPNPRERARKFARGPAPS